MTLKALASELYKSIKRVEQLEKEIADLSPDDPRRTTLEKELKAAKEERDRLKSALEGVKS